MRHKENKIILAVDTKDISHALFLLDQTYENLAFVKLGLEFFIANGTSGVEKIKSHFDMPIFLDLKILDIPNTVKGAVESACGLGIKILTVHISGGKEMLSVAAEVAKNKIIIAGVTKLTSLNVEISEILDLVDIAIESGVNTIICSPNDVLAIKNKYKNIIAITPGIRMNNIFVDDQKRISSPLSAIKNGADYIVVGREITLNNNPKQKIQEIARIINEF